MNSVVKPILKPVVTKVVKSADSGVPANVLKNWDGTPIRNADGSYIYTS